MRTRAMLADPLGAAGNLGIPPPSHHQVAARAAT